jgi:parvulin-like peptidyl-prolyl isomerase
VVTREDFEKLVKAVQPNMPAANRKPFATRYVTILLLAEKAHEMGLDKSPEFDEQMYIARLQLLARQAGEKMQRDAASVPDSEISDYYQQHASDYKTISFDRIFVPKQKPSATAANELNTTKGSDASEAEMKTEADKLRARAAAGEDPTKLQQEANDFAGNKTKVTNVKLENMRKTSIPASDAGIFDLKAGEVSQVFSDATGYRIYKVTEVKDLPLASVHDEIARALQGQKMKNAYDSLQNSAKTTFDNSYFSTPAAPSLRNPGETPAPQGTTPPPGKK